MPKGEPNKNTERVRDYMQKAGIIAKAFKVDAKTAEEFAKSCSERGDKQGQVITRLMREYINEGLY